MRTLTVALGRAQLSDPHRRGPAARAPAHCSPHGCRASRRAIIVSNPIVAAHWLEPLRASLAAAGIATTRSMIPDGEAHKTWARCTRSSRDCSNSAPSVDAADRAGRRRGRRRRRIRGGHLPARHPVRADPDDAAGAGRLVGRRQDRRQPSARQEHDRRVLPAVRRADRHRHAWRRCPRASSRRASRRSSSTAQSATRDFFVWLEANCERAARARRRRRSRTRSPRAAGSRRRSSPRTSARRASVRSSTSGTRSATRSRRPPATATGCTARPSPPAWCSRPSCRAGVRGTCPPPTRRGRPRSSSTCRLPVRAAGAWRALSRAHGARQEGPGRRDALRSARRAGPGDGALGRRRSRAPRSARGLARAPKPGRRREGAVRQASRGRRPRGIRAGDRGSADHLRRARIDERDRREPATRREPAHVDRRARGRDRRRRDDRAGRIRVDAVRRSSADER